MFNLKRKVANIGNSIKQSFEPARDVNEVIAEIHNEFDTAGERLLNEAKEILSKKPDVEKGKRLSAIGFTQSKEAISSSVKIKQMEIKQELANLIEYYQQHYPNNKFVNEATVKHICEKYGLLCAEVGYYKADVPEKNLTEIENFKLREEDMFTRSSRQDYMDVYMQQRLMQAQSRIRFMGDGLFTQSQQSPSILNPPQEDKNYKVKPTLKICAPEKDFDTTHLIKNGHNLELHIPDPIVLQPVNGGYLIVSKWGLEGQDETLVNEKFN